jgi:hypothetical protein
MPVRFFVFLMAVACSAAEWTVNGDVTYGELGDPSAEYSGMGCRLAGRAGLASQTAEFATRVGEWYRLEIRGLAQPEFTVGRDALFLRVAFFNGDSPLDKVESRFYSQVRREREDLKDAGTNRNLGPATWRHYGVDFRIPFVGIDRLVTSVGFANGTGKGEFWVNQMSLIPISRLELRSSQPAGIKASIADLVPIGGRWYFDPKGGSRKPPSRFDHRNADQLLYRGARLSAPFAGNTSAWLRDGYRDRAGALVQTSRFVPDNLLITVGGDHLKLESHNLPNHPTAVFPDVFRALDGNPNFVQEQADTWYLPFVPRKKPELLAMTANNANQALPGGPIGVAVNGVIFFNPFDHIAEADAVWRLDRCCGHPAPNSAYHYHKYPVCVKSPWTDDGSAHSPVIGFAFDGFPVYGPYERKGELAKDSKANPLNSLNAHHDEARGWHYHVTPGRFPHIIGGWLGEMDVRNRGRRGPRSPPRR